MAELQRPWELLDLADGEERQLVVTGYAVGEISIRPPGEGAQRTVRAMRLLVDPSTKRVGPPYYDVTSSTLQAQLEPQLAAPDFLPRAFTIGKIGIAPRARFTVRSGPVEVESRP